ncbi:hypothetical protein AAE02nite_26140 [Adhaeribacter aerolatus]|uniref:Uncharacterized protein n=1 Tax=Adhaeribacter aerolatus TaxID=670289 RepID=A0A512AZ26_9BACT|nr:hypothetical protein [Adhaeribacter aerolatus]GEO04950.1 hypothetical protein AAE02nite_26140 [Adhaeribacter aerolatus]
MKHIILVIMFSFLVEESVKAQTYKEQYTKCYQLMNGVNMQDTSYFTQKLKMLDCLIGSNAPSFSVKALDGKILTLPKLKGRLL